jgi:phosphatidylserine/phosphatidylglycerophosphate/cardiolipin synthase-like enzyme
VGGVIDELPARAEAPLRAAILKAASSAMPASEPGSVRQTPLDQAQPASTPSQSVEALFDHNDLVLGGTDHERTFFEAFGRARENVVVHSTFISENHESYLAPMLAAAARNVRIDILWGQSDDKAENSTSRTSATKLRKAVQEAGRSEQIRVHTLSTDSHAKILASDDGRGGWATVLGSCNWLSTDFASFESSVRLRDPNLAGEIINHLANLSLGSRGVWHPLADDLTVLARRISAAKTQTGRKAKLRVLLAPDHASLLLEARDRAQRRIVITSHRIGIAGQPMAIVPAVAAAQAKNVDASLYFGRATGPLSGINAADLTLEFERQGVHIRPIFQPRLHAKTLCWDDDALAVTSQNWLSASSSQNNARREIGIFIELNKIADTFIRRFEHARSQF